jgi:DNA-binding NarL/FixJ family response regulator
MLRILIADDSEIIRHFLRSMLSEPKGWAICGEAADGQHAVTLANELKPDLIVLDLAMPLLDGLHAAAEILKFLPTVPIVLYTLHKTEQIELAAKKAGVKAVVSKADDAQVLVAALQRVLGENVPASPIAAMSETLFAAIPPQPSADSAPDAAQAARETSVPARAAEGFDESAPANSAASLPAQPLAAAAAAAGADSAASAVASDAPSATPAGDPAPGSDPSVQT